MTIAERSSSNQVKNALLFNAIHQLNFVLRQAIRDVPQVVQDNLQVSLSALENTGRSIIAPLFARITEAMERILFTIHQEDFGKYVVTQPLYESRRLVPRY